LAHGSAHGDVRCPVRDHDIEIAFGDGLGLRQPGQADRGFVGDCEEEGMFAQPARKKADSAAAQARAEKGCGVTYVFQACRVESPV
jgi:hypothetical protein